MQNTIIKRLDIIKNAITIDEDELIEMQLAKLKQVELDKSAARIVELIDLKQFETVIQLIEQYKHDNSGLILFEDPQIQGLKLELKVLEDTANKLSDKKIDIERQINHFNSEYMLQLGDIIEKILKLKTKQDNSLDAQQAAEKVYESFHQDHQEQLKDLTKRLTEKDQNQLKKLYRQASRLCHPDKLSDEFKEKGEDIFKALSDAYRYQDLNQVEQILLSLKSGITFDIASNKINNKELLQVRVLTLRKQITQLEVEINLLKDDETYQMIQEIEDTEVYFTELKQALNSELEVLKEEIKDIDHSLKEPPSKLRFTQEQIEMNTKILSITQSGVLLMTSPLISDKPKDFQEGRVIEVMFTFDNIEPYFVYYKYEEYYLTMSENAGMANLKTEDDFDKIRENISLYLLHILLKHVHEQTGVNLSARPAKFSHNRINTTTLIYVDSLNNWYPIRHTMDEGEDAAEIKVKRINDGEAKITDYLSVHDLAPHEIY